MLNIEKTLQDDHYWSNGRMASPTLSDITVSRTVAGRNGRALDMLEVGTILDRFGVEGLDFDSPFFYVSDDGEAVHLTDAGWELGDARNERARARRAR